MSKDYPNRDAWLSERNARAGKTSYEVMIHPMPASGRNKDPGLFHLRNKGPLVRATGPGSYDEWKKEEWRKRRERSKTNSSMGA